MELIKIKQNKKGDIYFQKLDGTITDEVHDPKAILVRQRVRWENNDAIGFVDVGKLGVNEVIFYSSYSELEIRLKELWPRTKVALIENID